MSIRIERLRQPGYGDMPLVIGLDGLPVPDANEFLLGHLAKAPNTLENEARALVPMLEWLHQQNIDVWKRISSGKGFTEAEFRGGIIEALRRPRKTQVADQAAVSPSWFNARLITSLSFLRWYHYQALVRLQGDDDLRERIQASLDRIERMVSDSLFTQSAKNNVLRKHLTEDEQAFLVRKLDPKTEGVGESDAIKHRNYVTLMLMFTCGIRRGELLSMKVEDVDLKGKPQVNVIRRGEDPNDKRTPRPRVKRNGRLLPVGGYLAKSLSEYVRTWRNYLLDQAPKDSDFLILNKDGEPLSLRGLNALFERVRNAFPEELPAHFSPHSYRHTFSINFERQCRNAGMSEEQRQRALMYLRGDSSRRSQEEYIEAEVREQATAQLLSYQKNFLNIRGGE